MAKPSSVPLSELAKKVKERVSLIEMVREHSRQVRESSKKGEFMAVCPFHDDASPSLSVSENKGLYRCHGCDAKGDAITFYAEIEGVQIAEAIRELAKRHGVMTTEGAPPRSMSKNERIRESDLGAIDQVAKKYQSLLAEPRAGRAARELLAERRIGDEAIATFAIGYGGPKPPYQANRPRPTEQALRCGLFSQKGWEYMTDRIVFPIRNVEGVVVAFGGRRLGDDDDQAKYLNTPNTDYFAKSDILYGLYEARREISRTRQAIVVEGYIDVVSLHQSGVRNAVGAMSATLSPAAFQGVLRCADEIVLCLDGDAAGVKGALRTIYAAGESLTDGRSIRVAHIPGGMDPDEFVNLHGKDAFDRRIDTAMPASVFIVRSLMYEHDMRFAEGRAAFMDRVHEQAESFKRAPHFQSELVKQAQTQSDMKLMAYAMSPGADLGDERVRRELEALQARCSQLLAQAEPVRSAMPTP